MATGMKPLLGTTGQTERQLLRLRRRHHPGVPKIYRILKSHEFTFQVILVPDGSMCKSCDFGSAMNLIQNHCESQLSKDAKRYHKHAYHLTSRSEQVAPEQKPHVPFILRVEPRKLEAFQAFQEKNKGGPMYQTNIIIELRGMRRAVG